MKRREFIKTIPILAVAPMALRNLYEPPKTCEINLIALGQLLQRLSANMEWKLSFDSFMLINACNPFRNEISVGIIPSFPPESVFINLADHRFLIRGKLPELNLSV